MEQHEGHTAFGTWHSTAQRTILEWYLSQLQVTKGCVDAGSIEQRHQPLLLRGLLQCSKQWEMRSVSCQGDMQQGVFEVWSSSSSCSAAAQTQMA